MPEEGRRSGWGITPNSRWQPTDPPSVAGQVLEYALGYSDIAESTAWLRGLLNETPSDRPGLHIGPPGDRQEIRFVHPWKLSRIRIEGDLTDLSIVGTSDHNSLVIMTSAYSGDGPIEVSVGNTGVSFVGISLCSGGHSLIEKIEIFAVRPAVAQSSPTGYYYDPTPGRVSVEEISDIRHANVHVPAQDTMMSGRVTLDDIGNVDHSGFVQGARNCLDMHHDADTSFGVGPCRLTAEFRAPLIIQRVVLGGHLQHIVVRVKDVQGHETLVIQDTGEEIRESADSGNFPPICATAVIVAQAALGGNSYISDLIIQKVFEVRGSPPVAEYQVPPGNSVTLTEGDVLRVDSQGRSVVVSEGVADFYTVRSISTEHFTDPLRYEASVGANIFGLASNKVIIKRVKLRSVQPLDFEVNFWKSSDFDTVNIDEDSFCGTVRLERGRQTNPDSGPFYSMSGPLEIPYEDLDGEHQLHISLCNRCTEGKLRGAEGAVVVEVEYVPTRAEPPASVSDIQEIIQTAIQGNTQVPAGATITSAVVHHEDGTSEDITEAVRGAPTRAVRVPLMNPPHRHPRPRSGHGAHGERRGRHRHHRRRRRPMPQRDEHGRFIGRTSDEIEAEAQEVARSQFSPSEQASIRASNIRVPVDIGPTPDPDVRRADADLHLINELVNHGMSAQEAADRVLGRRNIDTPAPSVNDIMAAAGRGYAAAGQRGVRGPGPGQRAVPQTDRTGMFADPLTQDVYRAEPYIAEVPVSTHRPMRGTMELVGSYIAPTGIVFTFTEDLKPLFRIKPRSTPEENWKRLFKIRIEITDATLNMQLARIYEASLEDYEHPQVPEDDHYRTMGRARQGDVVRVYITNGTRDMTDFDIQVRLQANRLIRRSKQMYHDDRRPSGKFLHNPPVSTTGTLSAQQDGHDCHRSASQTQ
jgi:hypothetical protein